MRIRTFAPVTAVAPAVPGLGAPGVDATPSGLWDDFNGDGYRDLAIGTPKVSGGTVGVLLSLSSGVDPAPVVSVTQDTPDVPGGSHGFQVFAPRHDHPGTSEEAVDRSTVTTTPLAPEPNATHFKGPVALDLPLRPRRGSVARAGQAGPDAAAKVSA